MLSDKRPVIAYFLGTNNDWGGASRALLNFVRRIDRNEFCPVVVIPEPGPLHRILSAEEIDCQVWPIHDRSRNLPAYLWNIWTAMSFLKSHGIALMHLNYGAIGWKPAEIVAAHHLHIPMINHLHTAVAKPSSYIKYSAAVVGVSRYVCRNSGCQGVPCRPIHNVADMDRFGLAVPKRDQLGLKQDSIVVGFFGQVRRIKGISIFLELPKRIPGQDIEFLIAGALRGEDTFTAAEFSKMIEADPRIKYLGYREDVQDLYASCDIVVMPSQWEEPCAMVLFEASAAGKAIVATATGGTPEILIDGETGYLVKKDDIEALVSRVLALVRDHDLRRRIGNHARESAMNRFVTTPVRQLEGLYRTLLPHGT
jgi:glycosyltransferase involved in cell wall biosynthesis